MTTSIKYFFTFLFIGTTLYSEQIFIHKSRLILGQITLSHKYCKQTSDEHTLCKKKELSYIDYDDPDIPSFLKGIKGILKPTIDNYQKNDLKASTLADIKDFNADISGDWNDAQLIELFAKTPTTYTLATNTSGYSGGAHGYHAVGFDNYSIATQKALHLDDLFLPDYNKTLIHLAEAHYKRTHNLQPNQSLTYDGWFQNKFVLPENIAITTQGLYFHYNSYEIKSYADGHTSFLLPYSELYNIIDPKGVLGFVFQNKDSYHASFYNEGKAQIDIDTKINPDSTITLTATMRNLSYLNKGWFSLSFPQLQSSHHILKHGHKGFLSLHTYPKGSKVYHQTYKKAVHSHYLLVEGEDASWKYNDTHSISLILKVPVPQKELIIDIRSTLKSKEKTITIPEAYEGIEGQQGYSNYRVFIGL